MSARVWSSQYGSPGAGQPNTDRSRGDARSTTSNQSGPVARSAHYDWSNLHPDLAARAQDAFPIIPEKALLGTLGILARTVAPRQPRPGA